MIVVDDASGDRTMDVAQAYTEKDYRINLIAGEKNSGAGVARNRGIAVAKGRYIAFLDSDDEWMPEKLAMQIDFLKKADNVALCCSSYYVCGGDSVTRRVVSPNKITRRMLERHCYIGCLTAIYDTERTNGKVYMPEIRKRQDWALWLRITEQTGPAAALPHSLAILHREERSLTSNKISATRATISMLKQEIPAGTIRASINALVHIAHAATRTRKIDTDICV